MNQRKTTGEKLKFINKLEELDDLGNEYWAEIETLHKDEDSEVRLKLSKILALFPSKEGEHILLQMRKDPDYLVRVSVCDSLSLSESADTLKLLMDSAKDNQYLVRGYAVLSIGDIQCSLKTKGKCTTVEFLKGLYNKESTEWVRIAIARSLFLLGERSYGTILLSMVYSGYYQNRCFAVHLLEEVVECSADFIMTDMKPIFEHRLDIEKARSVKLSLIRLLGVLDAKMH